MSRSLEVRFLRFAETRVAYAMSGDGPCPVAPWRVTSGDAGSVVRALRSSLQPLPQGVPADTEPAEALLSAREREVLALVASGLNGHEVAEQLVLSTHTVHRHVANIGLKLGRGARTVAVAEATRLGLL